MRKRVVRTLTIAMIFSVLVFIIIAGSLMLTWFFTMYLYRRDIIQIQRPEVTIPVYAIVSIIVGTVLSIFAGKRPINRIKEINEATKEIAKGNFDIHLDENIAATELREMAHSFNIMTKELAGIELLRNDFIENVSHEFKTPLTAIEGYATLLQRKNLSEETRLEYAKKILYNTKRLSSLSGNILLLSRLENQELGITKEMFCLDEQLREIILSFEDQWTEKELELEIELDSADYDGSRDLLAHVWQNLLSNAIKFSHVGGKISIRLLNRNTGIKVSITDSGIGMSKEVIHRIFEKFYQGDTSRASHGNGLGLTLAKRIVDLHGGIITVTSKEGKGTDFTVTLPTTA